MKVSLEMVKEKDQVLSYIQIQIYILVNFIKIKKVVMEFIYFKKVILFIKVSLKIIIEMVMVLFIENKNQNIKDNGIMIKKMEEVKNGIVMEVNMKVFI